MASNTEGKWRAEFLLSEANGSRSRTTVTVTVGASTTFAVGSVMGQVTASGKYVLYDNAASDGREVAAGILHGEIVNSGSAADFAGVIIDRDAEVRNDDLTWKDGLSADDKTAGRADLLALGIKCRS